MIFFTDNPKVVQTPTIIESALVRKNLSLFTVTEFGFGRQIFVDNMGLRI